MVIKAWTIYLWEHNKAYHGAAPVVTKDGIRDIYRTTWEFTSNPDKKLNAPRHQRFRAKSYCKNQLTDTLNIINWYGKKVLDRTGNIDPKKFEEQEILAALSASKTGLILGIEETKPIIKFPVKEITFEEALEYNFV